MKKTLFYSCLLILFISVLSCNRGEVREEVNDFNLELVPPDSASQVRVIFYSLYLPTEMARLFERVGANYDPEILNYPDHFSRYREPFKIAANLGIYGVDLSYNRMFDRTSETVEYLTTIKLMAEKLGIPEDHYQDLLQGMEKYQYNKDSLAGLADEVFHRTDEFLKTKGNDSYAALIVMGGWIEALYIASWILDNDPYNYEVLDRIAEQKYALNSLISLLGNYQENIVFTEYVLLLKRLRKAFDRYEIYYDKENFSLDTTNQLITARNYHSGIDEEIVREIIQIVREIRERIVE